MEIRVDGKLLDLFEQETTMQWKSFVFADAIGDQFSTDIEIPLTSNNIDILKAYGLLYGTNMPKGFIRCTVSIDTVGSDGYIQINDYRKDTATITLYLSQFPFNALNKKIKGLISNPSYLKEWDMLAPTTYQSGHGVGLQRAVFSNDMGARVVPWSLRLNEFLSQISIAYGISINLPFSQIFRIVAGKPKVSPYVEKQTIYGYRDYNQSPNVDYMKCSQHVCVDVNSPRDAVEKMTATRDCRVKFTPYTPLAILINGNLVHQETSTAVTPASAGTPFFYNLLKGDEIIVAANIVSPYNQCAICLAEYYNFNFDPNEDTDTLVYPGIIEGYNGRTMQVPVDEVSGLACDGQVGRVRLSWAYMDYWWCIGDFTLRDLVNSLCHIKGLPITSNGKQINFGSPAEVIVEDGELISISPSTDVLGRVSQLSFNKESEQPPQVLTYPYELLPDSVTVFQSIFFGANSTDNGVAIVPMFTPDTSNTFGCEWHDCGVVMLTEMSFQENGQPRYALGPIGEQQWIGVDAITEVLEAVIHTYIDLRGFTYFHFNGQKFIIISADTDVATGLCEVKALLI